MLLDVPPISSSGQEHLINILAVILGKRTLRSSKRRQNNIHIFFPIFTNKERKKPQQLILNTLQPQDSLRKKPKKIEKTEKS